MRRVLNFVLACVALIVLVLAAGWAANGFFPLELDTHGVLALALGMFFTVALAITLMALVFFGGTVDREQMEEAEAEMRRSGRRG